MLLAAIINMFLLVATGAAWWFMANKKGSEYLLLSLIILLSLAHQWAFGTDAEDAYITHRYVDNLVSGNGFVFNSGERVEGYSNFLWAILVALFHKTLGSEIPITGRVLGVVLSVFTIIATFLLVKKHTSGNRQVALGAAFLIACSGSVACYGPSGLENPLFALLLLGIADSTMSRKYWLSGLTIALATLTRPEGIIVLAPVLLSLLLYQFDWKQRGIAAGKILVAAALILVPWTIWRVQYYGHLLPNAMASKLGMDTFYQIKLGLKYTSYYLIYISLSLIFLCAIPTVKLIAGYATGSPKNNTSPLLLIASIIVLFTCFYTYAGGDWMPAWRFYASIIPLFSVLIGLMWHQAFYVQKDVSFLSSKWSLAFFAFAGAIQLLISFAEPRMIPQVKQWSYQTEGLKRIGVWFNRSLPPDTLVAVWANGIMSFYDKLPTIDMMGLTDSHIARNGKKLKTGGTAGHISHDEDYVIARQPAIIAIMSGQGFEPSTPKEEPFKGYEYVTFRFKNYINPLGDCVNLQIRKDARESIVKMLLSDGQTEINNLQTNRR